jgi:hypothetical protein
MMAKVSYKRINKYLALKEVDKKENNIFINN